MFNPDSLFRSLVEHSVDGIYCLTAQCVILYASPSVLVQLGYTPQELIGRSIFDLIYEPDRDMAINAAKKAVAHGTQNSPGTQRWMHKAGHLVWIEVNGRMTGDEDRTRREIVIVTRDISARKEHEAKLGELALTDGLTGLRNRRGFDLILSHEWERTLRTGSPTSLLLLDLDHFKKLNDCYGHAVGDDCLRACANAFAGSVRRGIDFVARYGGEELAAILPDTNLEGAVHVAERVCRSVAGLCIPHRGNTDGGGVMTASIGVSAALQAHGRTEQMPGALVQAADCALYRAKQLGRNRVQASPLPTEPA